MVFGCCCCCRKVNPEDKPVLFVPGKDRKCTDMICLILFLVFWVGMAAVAIVGFASGNPEELLYGTDYNGDLCGTDGRGKRIYFPRITEDLINADLAASLSNPLDIHLFGICVDACPGAGDVSCTDAGTASLPLAAAALSPPVDPVANPSGVLSECREYSNYGVSNCQTTRENCWDVPLNTTEFFFRCVWVRSKTTITNEVCTAPSTLANRNREDMTEEEWDQCISKRTEVNEVTEGEAQTNPLFDLIYSSAELFGRMMDDVRKALPVILLCGGLLAFLSGFLWLLFIKSCAGCMVWLTIWLTFLSFVCVTVVAYWKANILTQDNIDSVQSTFNERTGSDFSVEIPDDVERSDNAVKERWKYFAYVMTAFLVVLLALIVWARKTIKIAIGIIKEASLALKSMKSLLLYPLVTFVLLLGLVAYWVFVLAYLASSGSDDLSANAVSTSGLNAISHLLCPVNDTDSTSVVVNDTLCDTLLDAQAFEADNAKRYAIAYHFFGLLWTNQFIQGMGTVIISGAVSKWYFTMDKKVAAKGSPCCSSTRRACRYHLGSIAFGALLIAIVQFIRALLAYLDQKSKGMQKRNKLWACIFKCVQCCLWCFEKCLKFITKFAFVIVALRGTSFCSSAMTAIKLMIKNAKRLVVVEAITTFLFVLGKVFIVLLSGLAAFAIFEKLDTYQEGEDNELDSVLIPLALTAILSFVIGTTFLNIYHLTIETILVCFCEDFDRPNAGTPENPYYMSDNLRKIVGASSRAHDVEKEVEEADGEPGGPADQYKAEPGAEVSPVNGATTGAPAPYNPYGGYGESLGTQAAPPPAPTAEGGTAFM